MTMDDLEKPKPPFSFWALGAKHARDGKVAQAPWCNGFNGYMNGFHFAQRQILEEAREAVVPHKYPRRCPHCQAPLY